ncbi:hypothetical protein HPP92_027856 [Vanilla planifolia]|uniref:Uncharacterized protein n=1 Tax=Vanilla planifolia TaxID=51239 RepID=A0A835PBE5_VANPL|nr:hypothetical protein HPP92_027856 [Vanilla planifolia]
MVQFGHRLVLLFLFFVVALVNSSSKLRYHEEDTLGKQSNLFWVYVAKATVVPPSLESPYRKIFLDSFDPIDQKTMTALYSNGLPSTC